MLTPPELLGNGAMAVFLFNSLVPLSALGVLTNVNFTSGGATKVLALLIFIAGVLWIGFGALIARRLNNGYREGTLTGQFFKHIAQDPTKKRSAVKTGSMMVGAMVFDSMASQVVMQLLPFPLNYMYWMGMWPAVPFLLFGLLPGVITFMGVGPIMSLAAVMEAGGDGTEYVEASKIHWFYSLSPADRDRVREGSDLEGGDDDSDSDDIEKRPIAKPRPSAPGRLAAHQPAAINHTDSFN